jgi:16S rRNA (uracil1498-N3)-methyltransferase
VLSHELSRLCFSGFADPLYFTVVFIPRVYLPHLDLSPLPVGEAQLPQAVSHHLVTVLHKGESHPVEVFNGRGWYATAKISRVLGKALFISFHAPAQFEPEPPMRLHLLQGLATGEKMDWIIEKAVELGALRITPVRCERSVLKLEGERAEKRLAHWRSIASAACLQSGQNWMPLVDEIASFKQVVSIAPAPGALALHADPKATQSLRTLNWQTNTQVQCWVGPEAGFSDTEQTLLSDAAVATVRLGPRILRTETAGLAMLAAIQSLVGDWR